MATFGVVPKEPPRQNALDVCAPKFAAAVLAVIHDMENDGYDPIVYETLRTPDRQRWLAGFGVDYDDGRGVVTHAESVYTTWHGFSTAADIISASKEWDAPPDFWTALANAAADHGLVSGSVWRMKDLPHVQWGPPMRTSPSAEAKDLLDQGGLPAVWQAVGAL